MVDEHLTDRRIFDVVASYLVHIESCTAAYESVFVESDSGVFEGDGPVVLIE